MKMMPTWETIAIHIFTNISSKVDNEIWSVNKI